MQQSPVDLGSDLVVHAARLVRAVRHEFDLPAGTRVLSLLDEHGPLGVTQLAALDRCSQPTMSALVANLVERGWVTKQPHPADARSSVVTLTGGGAAELRRMRRLYGERVATVVAADRSLSPEDLATAVAVLRAVVAGSHQPSTNSEEGIQ